MATPERSLPPRPAQSALQAAQSAPLKAALRPLLERVGGSVVEGDLEPDDIPIPWLGDVLFHVRLPPGRARNVPAAPASKRASTPTTGPIRARPGRR